MAYFYSSQSAAVKNSHRNIFIRIATNRRPIKLARDKPHYVINPFCFCTSDERKLLVIYIKNRRLPLRKTNFLPVAEPIYGS